MNFNEESVKNNIILPYLMSCGFTSEELSFEKKFTINLGRGSYDINGTEQKKANGRLDILCTRNNVNLFVIELKAEGIELTDKDRIQGLTYARLLEPMAPYVMLTNGKDTQIYNTYSGEELEGHLIGNWNIDGTQQEINLRFEALKSFVGLSYTNLLNFCMLHNKAELFYYRAESNDDIGMVIKEKYIPSLYIKREPIEDAFHNFIQQTKFPVFALVGESGTGKTNTIIKLAEQLMEENPVLFYTGTRMNTSLLRRIQNDFNLQFSSIESEIGILKKIDTLTSIHGKPLYIFIDALDEWETEKKFYELNELCEYFSVLGIKLCISCKAEDWEAFLRIKGIKTSISKHLFPNVPKLTTFNYSEFYEAISKYSTTFEVSYSDIKDFGILRNPFIMRIAFEVANETNKDLIQVIDSRKLFQEYLEQKYIKMPDKNNGKYRRILKVISETLFRNKKIQISEDSLMDALGLSVLETIPDELFLSNILYRYVDVDGRRSIGFYFSGIRDYCVSVYVFNLKDLSSNAFSDNVYMMLESFIGENALFWFFKTGKFIEKSNIIKTILQYDNDNSSVILPKIFISYGSYINKELLEEYKIEMFDLFLKQFILYKNNYESCEKIIRATDYFDYTIELSDLLINMLEVLLTESNSKETIAHLITEKLRKNINPKITNILIDFALNDNYSDYIRRYCVDVLGDCTNFDKNDFLKQIIQIEGVNAISYAFEWYEEHEDIELRDVILERIVAGESSASEIMALSDSRLIDTGKKLLNLLNEEIPAFQKEWVCRALGELNYKPAVPKLLTMIDESSDLSLRDSITITLTEMKEKSLVPILINELKKENPQIDKTWIANGISALGSHEDIKEIIYILSTAITVKSKEYLLYVLFSSDHEDALHILTYHLLEDEIEYSFKVLLLQELHNTNSKKLNDLSFLYLLVKNNTKLFPVIFWILVDWEDDIEKLFLFITEYLPKMETPISHRLILLKTNNLSLIASKLRPWIHNTLLSLNWSKPEVTSYLRILQFIGDRNSLEIIYTILDELTISIEEGFVNSVIHSITIKKEEIQFFV
ncbi:type I restriction enzyme HsdR N-terminal domain-containing protein [Aquibacillus koreensis]|uniref:Type I restriction enzyme HsdR N-terminal domain-containing protein n=1 Tax=Aquibacillus koreensis TaxID=279446 RepID=A0A9X3WKS9_9BACI|nr:type I restriction enzyme HsdR N-terminal domain-containing protein [Aquibacillus koreensis]MCT2537260.1 type I restriction enzyme HsdR N-terminal domain-containing protein [Aquibacillus koreensis]MDC3421607.1 type I restriction enzyme HsdR N-terminal domain-containing protein [Aquibacillus koreensis]